MKNLKDMIIEKLKIKKTANTPHLKNGKFADDIEVEGNDIIVKLPNITLKKHGDVEPYNGPERVWEIPNKKFYVFKDPYRREQLHLNHFEDFLCNIAPLFADYEDFKPENIVFASNSIVECVEFILNEKGITTEEFLVSEEDDEDSFIEDIRGVYDNVEILRDILKGKIDESEFEFPFTWHSLEDAVKEFWGE